MVNIWIIEEIGFMFVLWCMFLKVDLKFYVYFIWNFISFFIIDMEKKVVLCCYGFRDISYCFCMLWLVFSGVLCWYLLICFWYVLILFGYVLEELV